MSTNRPQFSVTFDSILLFRNGSIDFSSLFTEAHIEDFITISVDDTTFKISKDEMKKILANADLQSLGYKEEEKIITSKDSKGNSINSTIIQYFKNVPCSDAPNTFSELKDRISGKFGTTKFHPHFS